MLSAAMVSIPLGAAHGEQTPGKSAVISEVIVTATRRAERLRDVPISVTAVQADTLRDAGINNTRDLPLVVPGLRIENSGAYVQPTIRGITTTFNSPSAEANIATYVDGVYMNTQVAAVYDLPDVESVQVLKGPQGTLFGRNATGGAILINSVQPNLETFSGMVDVLAGRFKNVVGKGYVTGPIVPGKIAFEAAAASEYMDSYKHNLFPAGPHGGGLRTQMARAKLRVLPWEGADFTLMGVYVHRVDDVGIRNTNYLGNNANLRTFGPALIASRPYEYSLNEAPIARTNQRSVSLRGTIQAGPGYFTTTTAYVNNFNHLTSDSDNSPLAGPTATYYNIPGWARSFQQELTYTTNQIGRVRAVGGLFYFRAHGGQDLYANRGQFGLFSRERFRAYAAFAEAVTDITDRLSLTTGIRYSHDSAEGRGSLVLGPGGPPDPVALLGRKKWHAWTPRVSVLYKVTERTNVYATYSQGFKTGLFNAATRQAAPVDPERVKAYEIGLKSDAIPDVSVGASGFYYDYKNLQQVVIISTGLQQLANAAASKIYGVEVNGAWRPEGGFSLSGGATWLHGKYKNFPKAVINVPTGVGGNRAVVADVSGNTMVRSPKFSANLTAGYEVDTASGKFDATGTIFHSGKFYIEPSNRIVQPSFTMINASVGWQPPGSHLNLRVWGKNLNNEAVITTNNISAAADGVGYGPPRTYGVEAIYRF
jgi:iron complex outermembrane receptor protein